MFLGNGDGTFQIAIRFAVGASPYSAVVADFNSDGLLDLAVTASGRVSILLGNGDGTVQPAMDFPAPIYSCATVADFNGDGVADLAGCSGGSPPRVAVLLGNGDGTFQDAQSFLAGLPQSVTTSVIVGDFNGDGINDLVVGTARPPITGDPGMTALLLGNGDGTFQALRSVAPGDVVLIGTGDFNGDGFPDLVGIPRSGSNSIWAMLGNGDSTFQPMQLIAEVPYPIRAMAIGDFDADGTADLAVGNSPDILRQSALISVVRGNGDGTFQLPLNFPFWSVPASIAVADFNGDGVQDLAVAGSDTNTVSILLGNGDATFQMPAGFGAGVRPIAVIPATFHPGGLPDLAVINTLTQDVAILINTTQVDGSPETAHYSNRGPASGDYGTILRTTDGGANWTRQSSGPRDYFLYGVSFTDANTGTAVGQGGTILRTTDGGESWTPQSSGTPNPLSGVSFTDANTGSAVGGGGTILRTTDGGASWTRQSNGTTNWLYGVSFTDANTGTVVGDFGTILRTTTGGEAAPLAPLR